MAKPIVAQRDELRAHLASRLLKGPKQSHSYEMIVHTQKSYQPADRIKAACKLANDIIVESETYP